MSDTIIGNALAALGDWATFLRLSSFRGVPFYVDTANGSGGRRKVQHQYPLRDTPSYEDLGQEANKYRVTAFVVGPFYLAESRALISALQDHDDAAIFVHPWRGEIRCSAGLISWHESKDRGGYASFEIEFFVDTGGIPAPTAATDTVATVLAAVGGALLIVNAAYQGVSLMATQAAQLLGFVNGLFGGLTTTLSSLPGATVSGLGPSIAAIAADPGNDSATATSVQTFFQAASDAAIAAATPATASNDPIQGIQPVIAPAADLTGGLAALASWGNAMVLPANPVLVQQQQAIQGLVQGQAVLAVLALYASIDFPSANAAAAARAQVQAMIDAQLDFAATLGQDDLYRVWQVLGSAALRDLIARAQALPSLVSFARPASLPSFVLAQMWYRDADRADEIDALNDVPDPMFMPLAGIRLAA
jgi:prophage DNA circulation protein